MRDVEYVASLEPSTPIQLILWCWIEQHEIQPGNCAVKEFDFKNPARTSVGVAVRDRGIAGDKLERFDYLGERNAESDAGRTSQSTSRVVCAAVMELFIAFRQGLC